MDTSNDRDEGTSNAERVAAEVKRATRGIDERVDGYRDLLADAALECYVLTAEHDEQRININQKYDEVINRLARAIGSRNPGGATS